MYRNYIEQSVKQAKNFGLIKSGPKADLINDFKEFSKLTLKALALFIGRTREEALARAPEWSTDRRVKAIGFNNTIFYSCANEVFDAVTMCTAAEQRRFYKLANEFGKKLHKVPLSFPVDCIPVEDEALFIEFPEPFPLGKHFVHSVFLLQSQATHILETGKEERTIRVLMPEFTKDGKLTTECTFVLFPLFGGKLVEDGLEAAEVRDEESVEIIKYAMKAYCYVKSGDPDLRHLKVPDNKKDRQRFYQSHGTMLPFTIVGFDFLKERRYTEQTIYVDDYLAWRRCGPRFTQARLVTVSGHERTYGSTDE